MISADDPRMTPIALRKELLASGESDRSLARAVKSGARARPRRGAYVDGHVWAGSDKELRFALRSRAAYRQARAAVALSHTSALSFYDTPLWGLDLREVHLTRLDGRIGRREAGVRQHAGTLIEGDTVELHGLLLSSPIRASLEVTTLAPVEPALCVVTDLLHRGLTTLEGLRQRYDEQMERWPGSLRSDIVLRLADPRIESIGECRTLYCCWCQHLPYPEPQYEVFDDSGVLVARLDFALPDHGIWLEFDGRVKYERYRRPGESASDVVIREKQREQLVGEITGWRCLRITWADLNDPVRLAARIRALIESVASERARARR